MEGICRATPAKPASLQYNINSYTILKETIPDYEEEIHEGLLIKCQQQQQQQQQLLFRSNKRTRFEQDSERSLVII